MIHSLLRVILGQSVENIFIFFMDRIDRVVLNTYITVLQCLPL